MKDGTYVRLRIALNHASVYYRMIALPRVALTGVADPYHVDADPDPAFHFDADADASE
jgi:hypothetical protein